MYRDPPEHEIYQPVSAGDHQVRTHYQSPIVALAIPGLQALITGIFIGIAAGVWSYAFGYPHPWRAGFATWATIQALCWLVLLARWLNLVIVLESALGVDLNRDGVVGEQLEPQKVRIELVQDGGHHVQFVDLPTDQGKLIDLSRGLVAGASFSESQWSGAGALFSRSEFRAVRDEFLKRGWLAWRNPEAKAQGLELRPPGAAVVRYFASMSAADLPTLTARSPPQDQ